MTRRRLAILSSPIIGWACLSSPASSAETKTYTYDALGRLVKVVNSGNTNNGQTRSYCYDKAGNRIEFDSDSSGTPAACVTTG